jgi:hypothetical protein
MASVKRIVRLLGAAALLACAGVALGFVSALMRARPKSRYAADDAGTR